ncbi:MAG: alpha/beta hydrolase [Xanthobacteraceae bacterium]|nr:MAG: alpha/beta hydrolase [Xanthobacteraceae bacterium]
MTGASSIWSERGGDKGPCLVLLHGLGANGAVWDGMKPILDRHWPGRWLIPDFRGHGRSLHRAPYGIGIHAADVASLLGQDEEITIVGHSMGGVIAIALASGMFGVQVRRVVAVGVKTEWTNDDFARSQAIAQAPAKLFDSRDEAIERYVRVSGLKGVVEPTSSVAAAGIVEQQGKFRLAADPRTFALGQPDFSMIAKSALAPVRLLCGDGDKIASPEGMKRLGDEVTTLSGYGHNLHVEAPDVLWSSIADGLA